MRPGADPQEREGERLRRAEHVHPPGRTGHEILDLLDSAGADLTRVVLGHQDPSLAHPDLEFGRALDYQRSLADRGCYRLVQRIPAPGRRDAGPDRPDDNRQSPPPADDSRVTTRFG
ncbi:hypothetical protein [Amycolatopsis jejuensis]|uniref:hypothetical protein n=1 Tax=Amycolatopsis jejuensis TaxID=330084 RepID=UPI003CCB89F3